MSPVRRRRDDVRDSAHQALGHTARQLPRHEVKAAPNLVPGLGADFFLGSQFTQVPYKLLGSLLGVGHFKASAFFILEVELYPRARKMLLNGWALSPSLSKSNPRRSRRKAALFSLEEDNALVDSRVKSS